MHVMYLVKLPASTVYVFSMKLALESSIFGVADAQEQVDGFTRGLYDKIAFLKLVIFHTFGFYFVYSINFILDFLDASAGYCISFNSFVELEL